MQRDHAVIPAGGAGAVTSLSFPGGTDHCHLSLLAQDPHSLFVWWNVPASVLRFAAAGQPAHQPLLLALRIYEIYRPLQRHRRVLIDGDRPGFTDPPERAERSWTSAAPDKVAPEAIPQTEPEGYRLWLDIEVGPQNALYVNVPGNGRTYVAELGVYHNGVYRPLLRSLPHATPWGEPAETVDPSWPPLEMLYRTIRPLSFPSSPQGLHAP